MKGAARGRDHAAELAAIRAEVERAGPSLSPCARSVIDRVVRLAGDALAARAAAEPTRPADRLRATAGAFADTPGVAHVILDMADRVCPGCGAEGKRPRGARRVGGTVVRTYLCPACGHKWKVCAVESNAGL